jgi:hypothetical protein
VLWVQLQLKGRAMKQSNRLEWSNRLGGHYGAAGGFGNSFIICIYNRDPSTLYYFFTLSIVST